VYFALFGAGTYYILKMMSKHPGELAPMDKTMTRAAGITAAASLDADAMTPDGIEKDE